jgi:hypothetical protein
VPGGEGGAATGTHTNAQGHRGQGVVVQQALLFAPPGRGGCSGMRPCGCSKLEGQASRPAGEVRSERGGRRGKQQQDTARGDRSLKSVARGGRTGGGQGRQECIRKGRRQRSEPGAGLRDQQANINRQQSHERVWRTEGVQTIRSFLCSGKGGAGRGSANSLGRH